jgi:hypothetical protein
VNVDCELATNEGVSGKVAPSPDETTAHLAFRQIIVHDFAEDAEPQNLRLHFHFRGHSKHLSPRRAA